MDVLKLNEDIYSLLENVNVLKGENKVLSQADSHQSDSL